MNTKQLPALALAASLTLAPLIAAATEDEARVRAVSVAGLDLSKPGDVAVLHERIAEVARRMCAPEDRLDPINFLRGSSVRECVDATVAYAVDHAGSEALGRYHRSLTDEAGTSAGVIAAAQ
jgi:UrcA family protein